MNYLKLITTIVFLFTLITSCQKEKEVINELNVVSEEVNFRNNAASASSSSSTPLNITYSPTELIVQYGPTLTDADKNLIRSEMHVFVYEECAHCDGTIEKWDFGPGADIEHKYATAKEKEAEAEGLFLVDREFDFPGETVPAMLVGGTENLDYSSKIVSSNSGVTIAVLDSGIDANYPSFLGPFLYKDESDIEEIQSGWDYVEEDDNCYDDNALVHGTAVASIINNYLVEQFIPHQILPIKVADADGKVSLFKAYCSMDYAGGIANIIQMSFGWYDSGEDEDAFTNDIFTSLMEKYKDQVLFVTSAGNSGSDNDSYAHYPSNYDNVNNVSVAAANASLDDLAVYSNYGASTVDFISVGTDVSFINKHSEIVLISGTSFSAPQLAAIAAKELYLSGMELYPSDIVSRLDLIGTPVDFTSPTNYNKILLP